MYVCTVYTYMNIYAYMYYMYVCMYYVRREMDYKKVALGLVCTVCI